MIDEDMKDQEELKERIRRLDHISPDEMRLVMKVLTAKRRESAELQPSLRSALNIRITYDLVQSLRQMDETSAALSKKLVGLTRFLVVFTVVLVVFTAALLAEPVVAHFLHW